MMIRNKDFEIVTVAGESMAVPVGEEATTFHGVVTLSDSAAFMLNLLDEEKTFDEIVDSFLEEYDIDRATVEEDIKGILPKLIELQLILDS